jgi:hypothetical protein
VERASLSETIFGRYTSLHVVATRRRVAAWRRCTIAIERVCMNEARAARDV